MRSPDETKAAIVRQWLWKADTDVDAAEALLSDERPSFYPCCFFTQQAAEKYLKALLTWHQVEFPKTHSIREILNLVRTVDADMASSLAPAVGLTPYGVDVRYPSDTPEPTRAEAEEALSLARLVRDAVLHALPSF